MLTLAWRGSKQAQPPEPPAKPEKPEEQLAGRP